MKKKLLELAIRVARQQFRNHPEYRHYMHFSFVVQDNKIVEWGMNHIGKPSKHYGYRLSAKIHAELDAYRKARGLLHDGEWHIINVRINRQGELRLSAPCAICFSLMRALGCVRFWFSTQNGWAKTLR